MLSVVCCWCLCLSLCSFSFAENTMTEKPVVDKPALTQPTDVDTKIALEKERKLQKKEAQVDPAETGVTPEQIKQAHRGLDIDTQEQTPTRSAVQSISGSTMKLDTEKAAKDSEYAKAKKMAAEKLKIEKNNKDLKYINSKRKAAKKLEMEMNRLNGNQEKWDFYNNMKPILEDGQNNHNPQAQTQIAYFL